MSELLHKVRTVYMRFWRSHPAAARLSVLQRNFSLPAHCLICDVPTRWNSTLHMLDRLCEQQKAIEEEGGHFQHFQASLLEVAQREVFLQQQRPGTNMASQGSLLEDEEEDEDEACSQRGGTQRSSSPSLVRIVIVLRFPRGGNGGR